MKEIAIVDSTLPGRAMIRTIRTEACSHCGAQGMCEALGGSQENIVPVEDPIGVKVGQRVEVVLESRSFVTAMFVIYMIPVLALLAGAILGRALLPAWLGLTQTGGAVMGAIVLCAVGAVLALSYGRKLGAKKTYQPRIARIVPSGESAGPTCGTA